MKLYYMPGSCALAPHIIAREAGIAIEPVKVTFGNDGKRTTADGKDFYTINPKGYVPAMGLDNGQVLTEVPATLQYLADQKPASGLLPAVGSMDRYRVVEWLGYVSTELHKSFAPMFMPGSTDAEKQKAADYLKKRIAFVDGALAGKTYLHGENFTVADAYMFVVLSWANFVKMDLSGYPNVTAYVGRVAQRPKVQEAMKAEGLIK